MLLLLWTSCEKSSLTTSTLGSVSPVRPTIVEPPPPPEAPPPDARWEMADGYVLIDARITGDTTGDALPDALVLVEGEGGVDAQLVIEGPLSRDLLLPDDALASFWHRTSLDDTLDMNGDGIEDFVGSTRWIQAPQEGLVPDNTGTLFQGWLADVNGDRVADLQRSYIGEVAVEIWLGPTDGSGDPDVRIEIGCPSPQVGYDHEADLGPVDPISDLDADGVEDWLLHGLIPRDDRDFDCERMVIHAVETGVVSVERGPDVPENVPEFEIVGDQSGDGLTDILVGDRVLFGPIRFGQSSVSGQGSLACYTSDLQHLPFDIDQDGIGDWASAEGLLTGGLDGGVVTGSLYAAFPRRPDRLYFSGGAAWAMTLGLDVQIDRLGDATPAP